MNLCEEVQELCALPKAVTKRKARQLRIHYADCKSCRRTVSLRLRAGKVIERVFDGHRVTPKEDLEGLDESIAPEDRPQIGKKCYSRLLKRKRS